MKQPVLNIANLHFVIGQSQRVGRVSPLRAAASHTPGRGGQETRLHGLYSVGIGGHISEEDHGLFSKDRGYQEGMRRELNEEVAIHEGNEATVAVINDDSTEVGCVHFGVVHVLRVAEE